MESLSGVASTELMASMVLARRSYFSGVYLRAAHSAAKVAEGIEQLHDNTRREEHRQSVVVAVSLSVAAMEAAINEAWCDVVQSYSALDFNVEKTQQLIQQEFEKLERNLAPTVENLWKEKVERAPVKEKLRDFLKYFGDDQAARQWGKVAESFLWKKFLWTVEVRNLLIHFVPVTVDDKDDYLPKVYLREIQQCRRFVPNALSAPDGPFYPDRLLGACFARWAVEAAATLVTEFHEIMGIMEAPAYVMMEGLDKS